MLNRRQFVARTLWFGVVPTTLKVFANQDLAVDAGVEFGSADLETLAAALDELVPAGEGMPPASVAGGTQYLQYLAWQYPSIRKDINRFLKTLGQVTAATFHEDFRKVPPERRVQVLASIERTEAAVFSSFIGYVYEAYYTNPAVLGLISCSPAPLSIENDETLLAPVRKLTHLYREVR